MNKKLSPKLFALVAVCVLSACGSNGTNFDGSCDKGAIASWNRIAQEGKDLHDHLTLNNYEEACKDAVEAKTQAQAFLSTYGDDFSCKANDGYGNEMQVTSAKAKADLKSVTALATTCEEHEQLSNDLKDLNFEIKAEIPQQE